MQFKHENSNTLIQAAKTVKLALFRNHRVFSYKGKLLIFIKNLSSKQSMQTEFSVF